jgi:uncharacterized protein YbjQ (UPF0145 family)
MEMMTSTTFSIDGYRVVEHLGVVRGIVVRSPTIAQGFFGGLKQLIGGRIGAYTEMCEQARLQAFEHMVEHARELGANAIIGVRYDASDVARGATEVLCYGTAAKVVRG